MCNNYFSVSVLVNGSATNEFMFERGLRQGDPLSPFLFLLDVEGLNVMMNALAENDLFSGYGVGEQPTMLVSHLQFTNATLLVRYKCWENIWSMKAILISFEEVSDLKINFHKCILFGVNVAKSWLHEAKVVMNYKYGRLPFMYLGLPIGGDPGKLTLWYPLIDRICSRLFGWKS